jgi:flagellar hook-length control protein FliK
MGISILHAGNAPQALTGNSGGLPGSSNLLFSGLDFSALLGGQLAGQAGAQALIASAPAATPTALQDIAKQLSEKSISKAVDRDDNPSTTDLLQSMQDANPEWARLLSGEKLSASIRIASTSDDNNSAPVASANDTLANPAWLIAALPTMTPTPQAPADTSEQASRSDSGIPQQSLLSNNELRADKLVTPAAGKHFSAASAVDRNEHSTQPAFSLTMLEGSKDDAAAKIAANDASTPAQLPGNLAAQSTHLPRNTTASHTIPAPLHSTEWTQDFGNRVVWLARNDQQSAQININPANLGQIGRAHV